MRKIEKNYENFFDDFLIDIAEYVSPFFYKLNFTPNDITTLSLITGLASVYFLYKQNIVLFSILWIVSYFFDCLDGHFARKYDMVTKFGDLYDHVKDISVLLLLTIVSFIIFRQKKYFYHAFVVIIIFLILSNIHLTCQQTLYKGANSNDEFLDFLKYIYIKLGINDENCKEVIQYTKYFGVGTLHLIVVLSTIFLTFTN